MKWSRASRLFYFRDGSANAISSAGRDGALTATTTYCLPFNMYVIGPPVWAPGMYTSPTFAPLALSEARSIAPLCPDGVVNTPPSPEMTSVFVTSVPMPPELPPARRILEDTEDGIAWVDVWMSCRRARRGPE
jgi:hypothetical protein